MLLSIECQEQAISVSIVAGCFSCFSRWLRLEKTVSSGSSGVIGRRQDLTGDRPCFLKVGAAGGGCRFGIAIRDGPVDLAHALRTSVEPVAGAQRQDTQAADAAVEAIDDFPGDRVAGGGETWFGRRPWLPGSMAEASFLPEIGFKVFKRLAQVFQSEPG